MIPYDLRQGIPLCEIVFALHGLALTPAVTTQSSDVLVELSDVFYVRK